MFPFDTVDPQVVHHAAPVAHHVHHAAKHVATVAPVIHQGFSMLYLVISNVVSLLIGAGLGWYVKGRGLKGVQIDAGNAVKTVETEVNAVKTAA